MAARTAIVCKLHGSSEHVCSDGTCSQGCCLQAARQPESIQDLVGAGTKGLDEVEPVWPEVSKQVARDHRVHRAVSLGKVGM